MLAPLGPAATCALWRGSGVFLVAGAAGRSGRAVPCVEAAVGDMGAVVIGDVLADATAEAVADADVDAAEDFLAPKVAVVIRRLVSVTSLTLT